MKLFFLLVLIAWHCTLVRSNRRCRCLSTDPCWPSPSDFTALQNNLTQPLLNPTPLAAPCYSSSSPAGSCAEVQKGATDGIFRASIPGAMQFLNWETYENGSEIEACYLSVTPKDGMCRQGSVPTIGVDARVPDDIIAAVNFASTWGLRVSIKSTGHDSLGRSTARGSFLIWMHNMKDMWYDESFVPEGAPASETYQAVTIGPGVHFRDAYEFMRQYDRTIVGGHCDTVGAAGGWVQGGGHSLLSPSYGLGADQVLQFTVVTSTGKYLTASAYSHPRLFWALRGGGGGTFGVVTSVTYKTHPNTPLVETFFVATIAPEGKPAYQKLVTEFIRKSPELTDAGWGGFGSWNSSLFTFIGFGNNMSLETANALWDPFHATVQNLAGDGVQLLNMTTTAWNSWHDWYGHLTQFSPVGYNQEMGSRLFPREVLEEKYEELAQTIVEREMNFVWVLVTGDAVSKIDPDATGVTPAWRNALGHGIHQESWPEGASIDEIEKVRDRLRGSVKAMEKLSPGNGAYFNEASLYEENPRDTFFGSHYDRLKEIKDEYDPLAMFIVPEGVGSDEWDKSLNCRI